MIAIEKMNCGRVGLLGVSDVAIVSGRVIGSRGDLAERYRKVQLGSNQLTAVGVVPLAQPGLIALQVHAFPNVAYEAAHSGESSKHLL